MVCFMKDIQTPKQNVLAALLRCLSDPLISNVQQTSSIIFFSTTPLFLVRSSLDVYLHLRLFSRANDVHTSRRRGCNIAKCPARPCTFLSTLDVSIMCCCCCVCVLFSRRACSLSIPLRLSPFGSAATRSPPPPVRRRMCVQVRQALAHSRV